MKKIFTILCFLLLLVGCSNNTPTENNKIVDNAIEIEDKNEEVNKIDSFEYNYEFINKDYPNIYTHLSKLLNNEKLNKEINKKNVIKINFNDLLDFLNKTNISYEKIAINKSNYQKYFDSEYLDNNLIIFNYTSNNYNTFDFKTSILTTINTDESETKFNFITYILANKDGDYNCLKNSYTLDKMLNEANKSQIISIQINQSNSSNIDLVHRKEVKNFVDKSNYDIIKRYIEEYENESFVCQIVAHFYAWNYLNPNDRVINIKKVIKNLNLENVSLDLHLQNSINKYKDSKYFTVEINNDKTFEDNLFKYINSNELVKVSIYTKGMGEYLESNKKFVTNYQQYVVDFFKDTSELELHSVFVFGYEYDYDNDKLYYNIYDPSNNYICKIDEDSFYNSKSKINNYSIYTYVLNSNQIFTEKY